MVTLEDVSLRRLPTVAREGAMNMALDAVAAETVRAGGPASLRVYEWEPSTLSLGYAQDPATVDWEYCSRSGIEVTRRPTGGGAIYHDAVGDISYSIAVPRDRFPDDLTDSYQRLCRPLLDTFETLGLDVRFAESGREPAYEPACYLRGLHPAHDLVVTSGTRARKISGNAQHRQRDVIVQHGSILYSNRVERHLRCFREPGVDRETCRRRVSAIDEHVEVSRERVIAVLEGALEESFDAEPGEWEASELDRAGELVEERFANDTWVRRESAQPEA